MKIVKRILIVVLALVAIVLITAAFMPKQAITERSTTINAPAEVIYSKVINLEEYVEWMPWKDMDPNMQVNWPEEGPRSGLGASYSWISSEMGNGNMKVAEAVEFESIVNHVFFEGMGDDPGLGTWKFEEGEEGTKVTWSMDMKMPYPFNILALVMPDPGPSFEKGLANLKEVAESTPIEPEARTENIEVITMDEPLKFVSITESATMEELANTHAKLYGELGQFCGANGIEMTANPLAVYLEWGETITLQAGFPVASDTEIEETDRVKLSEIPAGSYVKADHFGPYAQIDKTHAAIDQYMNSNGLSVSGPPWEHYVDDPGDMSDMANVKTVIYYPTSEEM